MKSSKVEKLGYGAGAVGKDMVYAFVSGFLMYYFNTVIGVSATFIGVLFMGARVFDAFNDPIMGIVVEKTNTKMGKFRPWLLIGTVLNAIVLYFMFSIPEGMEGSKLLFYVGISYALWGVTYTIMDIPYWSMIPAITNPGKDRENMSVLARSCAGVGFALVTGLTMVLINILGNGNERIGFKLLAIIIGIIFIIAIIITVGIVREKNTDNSKTPNIKEMFNALIKNDQALFIVITIIIFNSSLYLTQNLAIYFFKYDIGNAELFGLFGTVGGVTQILSMMSLPMLRKKYSTHSIFKGAIFTTIIGYLFLFTLSMLNINNILLLCLSAVIIFIGFGLATVLTTIFLADTVDYGYYKTKQRNESVIFSLQTFVVKLASAFSVLIAGIGIDIIKLDVNTLTQQTSTLIGMRLMMTLIPIVGLVVATIIFKKKYILTESYLMEITNKIKGKN